MGNPVPYVTVAEVKRSPIFLQLKKLVPGSSDAERDAELAAIVLRISAMINREVNQNLAATVDHEVGRVTVSEWGELRIHTRSDPIVEIRSLAVGPHPSQLTPITDLSDAVMDPWRITIPAPRSFFGTGPRRGARLWAEWTYVNGYPVTTLSAPVEAGDTSVSVVDATGIVPGRTILTIEDGSWIEAVTPAAVDGNVLTVAPLMFAHQAGTGIHGLPGDVKEATLLLLSRLHDTWSLSMGAITHDGTGAKVPGAKVARPMCDASVMLAPYRRWW